MKILLAPCHSILEYDEVKLWSEIGHDVFSMDSYRNPASPIDVKRPAIEGMEYHEYLDRIVSQTSRDDIHQQLIDWADVIVFMHMPQWVQSNWQKVKHKKVVYRSIGQSSPACEAMLAIPKNEGLKIVRYSPAEERIFGYVGSDALIRFYKDPEEFGKYSGNIRKVITFAQNMKTPRSRSCNYDVFMQATQGFPRTIYGPGNEDTGCDGGRLPYEDLKKAMRVSRVYFYTGTYPASYTLNFIEAFMTGIPVVAIGRQRANIDAIDTYEVNEIIENGINGFCSDNVDELKSYVKLLMDDPVKAHEIGRMGRETAKELFGKETIKKQWKEFFDTLC